MDRFSNNREEELAQTSEFWETVVKYMPVPGQMEVGEVVTNCDHLRWLKCVACQARN